MGKTQVAIISAHSSSSLEEGINKELSRLYEKSSLTEIKDIKISFNQDLKNATSAFRFIGTIIYFQ